jgi:hypothetical protein
MSTKPIAASPKVQELLQRLHTASRSQDTAFSSVAFYGGKYFRSLFNHRRWSSQDDDFMRDKFVALEHDKCEFLYLLARATGAVSIVEAGTSFGVSTIYLALAAGQNAAAQVGSPVAPGQGARVIATEKEPSKAKKAREHWLQAGEEVEPWITLLEGDLLETLPKEIDKVEKIDLLLLDSMLNDPYCHGPAVSSRTD